MASLFKSTTTYDPIFALLNAETLEERDFLTGKWRDHKLEELNFIGIVVSTLSDVLYSSIRLYNHIPDYTLCSELEPAVLIRNRLPYSRVSSHQPAHGLPSFEMAQYSHGRSEHVGTAESFWH